MKRTVYYGGDILTLEGGGRAEALLVEDGVIRELGTKEALLASFTQQGSSGLDMAAAVVPLLMAFLLLYMPLLPIRRILTAAFALWDRQPQNRSGAPVQQAASAPAGEAAPAFTPGENGPRA